MQFLDGYFYALSVRECSSGGLDLRNFEVVRLRMLSDSQVITRMSHFDFLIQYCMRKAHLARTIGEFPIHSYSCLLLAGTTR
jgi:hypothetical protein